MVCPLEVRFIASMAADEKSVIDNKIVSFWLTIKYTYLNHKRPPSHLYLYATFLNYQSRNYTICVLPLEYLSPKLPMNPGCPARLSERLLGIATVTMGT